MAPVPCVRVRVPHTQVHIHTDTPQNVFDVAARFGPPGGKLRKEKVEDMLLQSEMVSRYNKPALGLVGDTSNARCGIIASSAALMFDMPSVLPGSPTANTLELLDYLSTAICLVEMVLKMIAYGVFNPPDGYLLDGWNVLDAFIVTTSVLALAASGVEGLSVFRSMRAMRTLRPLRVIQRNPGLKQVVNSFLRAIPGMWSVVQVCALVFLVYGRFMMQFLSGRMAECSDSAIVQRDACVGTFFARDGTRLPRVWINADVGNFDNIFMAMLTLFEMSTLEMWPDMMFSAIDALLNHSRMAQARRRLQDHEVAAILLDFEGSLR